MSERDLETEVTGSAAKQYLFRNHNVNGSEWERLDELHHGFSAYMNGKLTFAPLDKPSRILDIGAGSGAWVLEAANTYPQAEVVAADIAPLPTRPFPPNVKYQQFDVLAPLPFEDNSFDVVHIRLVLYHLPTVQHESVLQRVSRVIKPKGWLIIEDLGQHSALSGWPAQDKIFAIFDKMLQSKGLGTKIGEHLVGLLQRTDAFRKVNVERVELTITTDKSPPGISSGELELTDAIRSTIFKVSENLMNTSEEMRAAGLSSDLKNLWLKERQDPRLKTFTDVWFAWAQKR